MKQLKKDTLKNGDVFNISFLPRGDDAVSTTQWQTSFRKAKWITDNPNQNCFTAKCKNKAHSYLKFWDMTKDAIRTASTEFASVFVNINGESYIYKGEDDV